MALHFVEETPFGVKIFKYTLFGNIYKIIYAHDGDSSFSLEFEGTLEKARIAGAIACRKYHQKLADEAAQEIFKSFGM